MEIQDNHRVIKLIGITFVKLLEAKWGGGGAAAHSPESAPLQSQLGGEVGLQLCSCADNPTSAVSKKQNRVLMPAYYLNIITNT